MVRFIGRQQELARLSALWEQSRAGRPRHVVITGEAGIGKTRLVEELATRVRQQGARVLRGRSWDVGAAPAYWPWTQAFESYLQSTGPAATAALLADTDPLLVRLFPRLRHALPSPRAFDPDGSEAARLQLFGAVARLLERMSASEPLLIVLDELESADLATLHLLRFLVRAGGDGACLIVALHRSPLPPGAPAAPLLSSLGCDPAVALVHLQGLDLGEIEALAEALFRLDPRAPLRTLPGSAGVALQARTAGNPLFALEFLRLMAAGRIEPAALAAGQLPAGVRSVIGQRLAALPPRCRTALAVAAVVGQEIEIGIVATVAGVSTEVALDLLAPAIEGRLLLPDRGRPLHYGFSHPLVREALCEELATTVRAELHGRVAEVLRARFASTLDEYLDAIASHYLEAVPVGAASAAVEFCRRAAGRASVLAARDEALRFIERAADVASTLDDVPLRCEVSLELGEAQARVGQVAEARATLLRVAERAEALGRPTSLARAALGLGGRFVWARASCGSPEVALLERALAALPDGELSLRARLLARLAGLHRDRRRAAENRARCEEALGLARAAGDHGALTQVLNALALHELMMGSPPRLLAAAGELLAADRTRGDLELELQAHDYRAMAFMDDGQTLAAEDEIATCERLADRLAQPAQRWFTAVARAQLSLLRGELARAEELAEVARALGQTAQPSESRFCHLVQLYGIRREQDRLREMEPLLEAAAAPLANFPIVRFLLAHLWAETGRPALARGFLDGVLASDLACLHDSWQFRFLLALATEMAFRLAHVPAAVALEPLLLALPHRHLITPPSASAGSVHRYRGLLHATLGRPAPAIDELALAAQENRAAGATLWALRCDLDRARLLALHVSDEEARATIDTVSSTAQADGSPALAAEARALAPPERAPIVPARVMVAPDDHGDPLVRREGDVWTLVFAGRAVRLRDGRGLQYLAQLLANPGRELAALQLVASSGGALTPGATPVEGSSGPLLDASARAAFERRLAEITAELHEAEGWNDPARVARLEWERDELARELSTALGVGGRARGFGDRGERARQSVTKALKATVRRIARAHPELGRHLDSTVRTGFFCRYESDPLRAPIWTVRL